MLARVPCLPRVQSRLHRANRGQIFGFPTRSPLSLTARLGGGGLESETEEKERIDFSHKKTWGKWIRFSFRHFFRTREASQFFQGLTWLENRPWLNSRKFSFCGVIFYWVPAATPPLPREQQNWGRRLPRSHLKKKAKEKHEYTQFPCNTYTHVLTGNFG